MLRSESHTIMQIHISHSHTMLHFFSGPHLFNQPLLQHYIFCLRKIVYFLLSSTLFAFIHNCLHLCMCSPITKTSMHRRQFSYIFSIVVACMKIANCCQQHLYYGKLNMTIAQYSLLHTQKMYFLFFPNLVTNSTFILLNCEIGVYVFRLSLSLSSCMYAFVCSNDG